ncbi:hypothetical protein BC827DRAFT_1203453 [Russula dissimulans]|nr:hypothetical protein BC827DRAFT_1203453 [Russula dissimulans]
MIPTIAFYGGSGGPGGPGSGSGSGPSPSRGSLGSDQPPRTGTTNQDIARRSITINLLEDYTVQSGHLTIIDGPPAKRLILTANCDYTPDVPGPSVFTFLIDVILVPRFINVKWEMPCFYLYKTPFDMRQPPEGYMGLRSLQDNIILVRRIAFQGAFTACTVEHCDFPQDVSNLSDYRLVVTCPLLHTWPLGTLRGLSVILHLEVEYEKET